jgi:hypothetical protein
MDHSKKPVDSNASHTSENRARTPPIWQWYVPEHPSLGEHWQTKTHELHGRFSRTGIIIEPTMQVQG